METESDIFPGEPIDPARGGVIALYVAFSAHEPMRLPARHVVTDVDVIRFGRGDLRATRERRDGLRHLVLQIPDPLMSGQHGQLVQARGSWMLDDPSSKNGAVVRGERTRASTIGFGDVFALGNTIFLLVNEAGRAAGALDTQGENLAAPVPELATFDPGFASAIERMSRIATTELPVLFLGETGTGKEVAARALHELSQRRGSFVAVNCGALVASLVESELFGHRKGAFSGAATDKLGYIRTADHGTLFLDEIGELPLPAQTALLRVLQEREVVPVGSATPVAVDLRVCAATHRDLEALVAAGTFREDLYARLLGLTVALPALRRRRADMGLLIPALLRRLPRAERTKFTPAAAVRLFEYEWPRNVRELERVLSMMTALAGKDAIGIEHVPDEIRPRTPGVPGTAAVSDPTPMPEIVVETPPALTAEEMELKDQLEQLLREHDHNLAEVARRLGKDRTQIYRWVRRFGIQREGSS